MKRLVIAISFLFSQVGIAQKTEFTIGVDGTVSFFRGPEANSTAILLLSDVPGPATADVTIFPYGKKPGLGAGAYAGVQQVNKKGLIAGVTAGYETMASKVKITWAESQIITSTGNITPANGTSKMTHTFINVFPYIGKRFNGKKGNSYTLDLDVGLDIGVTLSAHEKGETKISGNIVKTDRDHRKQSVDFRPRLQLRVQKKNVGVQSSFSFGLTNYHSHPLGTGFKAYSNIFRLGVFYVL